MYNNKSHYDVLYLLSCAVKDTLPDKAKVLNMDFEEIYGYCMAHSVAALVCSALDKVIGSDVCLTDDKRSVYDKLKEEKFKAIRKNALLDIASSSLERYLDENHIWYIPVKGKTINSLYPSTGLRSSADRDYLFDKNYRQQVKEYFEANGYSTEYYAVGNHDVYHKEPVLNFEMHVCLFSQVYNQQWCDYYDSIIDKLVKDRNDKCKLKWDCEDFYVYFLAHTYKHYSNAGVGLKTLLDTFVIVNAYKDVFDWDYINEQLQILGIKDFEASLRSLTIKVITYDNFDRSVLSDDEFDILNSMFESGTYGSPKTQLKQQLRKMQKRKSKIRFTTKVKYLLGFVFPPVEEYKNSYPFFYKHKYLIPFLAPYRVVKALIKNREKIKSEVTKVTQVD